MDQNKNNAKTEKTTAQKVATAVSWVIVAASIWYWLSPNEPIRVKPAVAQTAEQQQTHTVYTSVSPQALASATQYLADLDNAMTQGLQILKANNLKDLSTHSQRFKALRESGQTQFGRSIFEPLGHCASAGIFANSWWQAEISAARQADKQLFSEAIENALTELRAHHSECLKAVTSITLSE
ncbi:hypothetical protein ACI514_08470 [Pseudomonas sp. M20]|uniref:hypothetical protein n=1 Tax=Pseudomonas sp. M20 TaxID=3379129 RepID=UPI00386BB6AB